MGGSGRRYRHECADIAEVFEMANERLIKGKSKIHLTFTPPSAGTVAGEPIMDARRDDGKWVESDNFVVLPAFLRDSRSRVESLRSQMERDQLTFPMYHFPPLTVCSTTSRCADVACIREPYDVYGRRYTTQTLFPTWTLIFLLGEISPAKASTCGHFV